MKKWCKKTGLLCLLFATALVLCSCQKPSDIKKEASAWAYDTFCSVTVYGYNGEDLQAYFETQLQEGQMLFSPDAQGRVFAQTDGQVLAFQNMREARLMEMAWQLSSWTDGAFDLTVAPLSALWNVSGADRPPEEQAIADALSLVGYQTVACTEEALRFSHVGQGLDLGAFGKGNGGDLVADRLQTGGALGGMVDLGGNITLFGSKPDGSLFRIGVRDPADDGGGVLGILNLTDTSVVTSGGYERYFEYEGVRYHHILDPRTGWPAESDLLSATVVCSDGALADMLSTACFLLGEERALALLQTVNASDKWDNAQAILVLRTGEVVVTSGLSQRFSLTSSAYRLKESPL